MQHRRIPAFIGDLFVDRAASGALLAGSVALFAAAIDPQVWSPMLPTMQAGIRQSELVETALLLASVAGAGLILLGGAVGDTRRPRTVMLAGLLVELLASVVCVLVPDGPLFVAARLTGHAGAAFVIPVSIALVATSYKGAVRATAIGIAYAAYGAAGAVGPILLQIVPGQASIAMAASIAACAIAMRLVWTRPLALQRPTLAERPLLVGIAAWAFGIITFTIGLTWIDGSVGNPLRWALIIGGPALVVGYERVGRANGARRDGLVQRRVAIALFIGIVVAISQTAAMLNLPLFFHLVLGYGPLVAVICLAPLFAGMILAGPLAGYLLGRVTPRVLVGGGAIAIGLANLLLMVITTGTASYLGFIVPCAIVGAGYSIATTVRTAIIFASVPTGLPATAAALNESSMTAGSRLGIVLVSAIVAQLALGHYTASVAGLAPADAAASIAAFRSVLDVVGTPSFAHVAASMGPSDIGPFLDAYIAGLRDAYLFCGLVGVVGGAVALLGFGRQDPLQVMWDYRDERVPAGSA